MMVSCISRTLNIVAVAENQLFFYTPSDIGFVFIIKITSPKIKSYIFIICAPLVCQWKERDSTFYCPRFGATRKMSIRAASKDGKETGKDYSHSLQISEHQGQQLYHTISATPSAGLAHVPAVVSLVLVTLLSP